MSHTPGPWMAAAGPSGIVGWPIVGPKGRMIADVSIIARQGNSTKEVYDAYYGECKANANLIAAAPELLEALKALLPEGWGDDDTMDHMPGVKLARAAIAKAGAA